MDPWDSIISSSGEEWGVMIIRVRKNCTFEVKLWSLDNTTHRFPLLQFIQYPTIYHSIHPSIHPFIHLIFLDTFISSYKRRRRVTRGGWLPFMDLSQLDRISFWQGPHKLYLRSEDIMKFRQNNPPFPPLPVHSIANYLSFHPSIQPFIHSLALPNNVDSSRACPIVLFLRPGYPGTCIPMYTTMSLKFFGRHFSVD